MRLPFAMRLRPAGIRPARSLGFTLLASIAFTFGLSPAGAATLEEARQYSLRGNYTELLRVATEGRAQDPQDEEWAMLQVHALLATGRYGEAQAAVESALSQSPASLRLRLLGYEVSQQNGDTERAKQLLEELDRLAGFREWSYQQPAERIALGKAALLAGADPKRVLDRFFEPVKKARPDFRDSYLASGQIALEKSDFALAAKVFGEAAKRFPDDPDIQFGLAQALETSEPQAMLALLEKALATNPNHIPARLLLVDFHIDSEQYDEARKELAKALAVNPSHPEALAFRAVISELQGDLAAAKEARTAALKTWPANPQVDHLIGRKFSQKYRFAEGSEHQRLALKFQPGYLPAKIQLAQDLLRLGNDQEGWKLAQEVQEADPYDVVAYNLVTLRDSIAHFEMLKSENFMVRMDPKEAAVYGDKVLALLERAHAQLCKKYGLEPKQRTIVEIFPDQKDFAIRTFGLPGGAGYLGVCFGRVITANSPASRQGSPANWESILWHEFAHVVTLQLTKNRMPRWLSEGISVYEERQARGIWGEQMKPRYRAMILGEDLTPVSELSGAFLKPKSPMHLQFAYYQSSLAVEYLLERFGIAAMKRIFTDLAQGVPINAALAKHAAPLEQIDREFADRARNLAKNTGPKLDWSRPQGSDVATEEAFAKWIAANPNNFTALREQAAEFLKKQQWEAAKAPLRKLIELYPEQHEADSAYAMLALAHRKLGETDQEYSMLQRIADLAANAPEAYERLMQIAAQRKDWAAVLTNSERYAAVDPLKPAPHEFAAQAHEALDHRQPAIGAYRTLLRLGATNPSETHFRLAKLLHQGGDGTARRHVLQALEDAPRFRPALQLLLEMERPGNPKATR